MNRGSTSFRPPPALPMAATKPRSRRNLMFISLPRSYIKPFSSSSFSRAMGCCVPYSSTCRIHHSTVHQLTNYCFKCGNIGFHTQGHFVKLWHWLWTLIPMSPMGKVPLLWDKLNAHWICAYRDHICASPNASILPCKTTDSLPLAYSYHPWTQGDVSPWEGQNCL